MPVLVELNQSKDVYQRIMTNLQTVIRGKDQSLRQLLAAFFTGQHVLLEDVPGTGKTTMAKALAASVTGEFQRVQFTPDLLPSDITGVSVYNQQEQSFHFHKGPIFTQILLADEINRASPRTQSALLEAMAEKQVSIDGQRYKLDQIFFVIATQNPVETHGTYPLPEAQMDRFGLQFSLGYLDTQQEVDMLTQQEQQHPLDDLKACASPSEIMTMRETIKAIHVSDEIKHYLVNIVNKTRETNGVKIGASFRASLALMQSAQALALFEGQSFVTPDQIKELAIPVLAHRLTLDSHSRFGGKDSRLIVQDIIESIPVPT